MNDTLKLPRAKALIVHHKPTRYLADGSPDPDSYVEVSREEVHNLITKAGMDFIALQVYGSAGLGANGLNYIALSNDAVTEDTNSTTLSNEIAANGLTRAQGTYAHTAGQATITISKNFTATGSQSCRKAALFSAGSGGSMNHVLGFTQVSLVNGSILAITFTITLS